MAGGSQVEQEIRGDGNPPFRICGRVGFSCIHPGEKRPGVFWEEQGHSLHNLVLILVLILARYLDCSGLHRDNDLERRGNLELRAHCALGNFRSAGDVE
jgi:hypothetical protein